MTTLYRDLTAAKDTAFDWENNMVCVQTISKN